MSIHNIMTSKYACRYFTVLDLFLSILVCTFSPAGDASQLAAFLHLKPIVSRLIHPSKRAHGKSAMPSSPRKFVGEGSLSLIFNCTAHTGLSCAAANRVFALERASGFSLEQMFVAVTMSKVALADASQGVIGIRRDVFVGMSSSRPDS